MKYGNKLLFVFLLLFLFDWSSVGNASVVYNNLITMTVDSFDDSEAWVAKFSKNRQKNWSNDASAPYEDSNTWIKWLNSADYDASDILPYGIFRNALLKDKEKAILAVRAKFNTKGYNWIILEPKDVRFSKDNVPSRITYVAEGGEVYKGDDYVEGKDSKFIWMPGKVKSASVYVWGNNYDYTLEAHFEDSEGRNLHVPVSSLKYKGWRNLRIYIPVSRESIYPLKFKRFKIKANPDASPGEFYTYFDYFHALVDTYEKSYFGEELQFVEKYWSEGNKSKQTSEKK